MKFKQSRRAPRSKEEVFSSKKPLAQRSSSQRRQERASLPEGVFVVEGVAAIREYLRHRPKSVIKVFAKDRSLKLVRDELADFRCEISVIAEDGAEQLPPTPAWAHVKHESLHWSALLEDIKSSNSKNDLVVVLDHISDPRNLGAIVRTAAFFGVRYVIVPEKRQVLLTQASVNTAQGGFALTDLVVVVNVSRALEELKSNNFWVLGAAMDGDDLSKVRGRFERQALVLGAEDKGISQHVLGRCDVKISVPGAPKSLDSLNVSVAAGILMHGLFQRQ